MKKDSITIKDIAKALNLSFSSVSRALQDSHQIGAETKKRVMDYAKENNYRPNLMAQSLKNKNSRTIGIVISTVPNNFLAEVVNGIESVTWENNYNIIITQSQESFEKELKNLDHLVWKSVDGLLVSLSTETKDMSAFNEIINKTPIVFFDRVPEDIATHKIEADNYGGAKQLTQHLLENGYRRIAQITSSKQLSITKGRLKGYMDALRENSIAFTEDYVCYCDHGGMHEAEVEAAVDRLLQLPEPPDAIITASDRITIGTLSILHKKKIAIPTQMGLAGFTNFSSPHLFNPSLTTIKMPAFEMGKQAAEALFQLINKKKPKQFEHIVLPTELTVRDSTAKKL